MSNPQHDIRSIIDTAEAIGASLPAWLTRHTRLVSILDGLPAGTDDPHVTATSDDTSTERAALARVKLDGALNEVHDEIAASLLVLRNLRRRLEHTLTLDVEIKVPRCSSEGRDGAIEWGDPTCRDVPSRGPLCDRCSKREYRWRERHDLPPRHDGVFTAPAVEV